VTGFAYTVDSVEALRALYRDPTPLVLGKKKPVLDAASTRFIASSPFVLVGTTSEDRSIEVSPRGGPPGFVRVIDSGRLAIPDLNGNNLVDSLLNIVRNPSVGLLFVHPGKDETLRVNGRAWVTTDPWLLAGFTSELRTPKAAIGVEITEVFIHCAKAFRRGRVWEPEAWPTLDDVDAVDIIQCQMSIDVPKDVLLEQFKAGYAAELAED
jgi:uncharacterized protein